MTIDTNDRISHGTAHWVHSPSKPECDRHLIGLLCSFSAGMLLAQLLPGCCGVITSQYMVIRWGKAELILRNLVHLFTNIGNFIFSATLISLSEDLIESFAPVIKYRPSAHACKWMRSRDRFAVKVEAMFCFCLKVITRTLSNYLFVLFTVTGVNSKEELEIVMKMCWIPPFPGVSAYDLWKPQTTQGPRPGFILDPDVHLPSPSSSSVFPLLNCGNKKTLLNQRL